MSARNTFFLTYNARIGAAARQKNTRYLAGFVFSKRGFCPGSRFQSNSLLQSVQTFLFIEVSKTRAEEPQYGQVFVLIGRKQSSVYLQTSRFVRQDPKML